MERFESFEGGVCSAKGFRAAGVAAGIKYKNRKDVALIVADAPCSTAAMFTTNALAAHGKNGYYLIVVSGVNIQFVSDQC